MASRKIREQAKEIAEEWGYLPYMLERYLTLWGMSETIAFLEACEKPIPTAIRLNPLLASPSTTIQRLSEKGVYLDPIDWIDLGYVADFQGLSPGALMEHMLGHYYVQGVPSMTVVDVLNPQPGEVIMDLASAPGGKTTHIGQRMNNTGIVVSIENDRKRIQSLESNIQRCGVTNSLVIRGDARRLEEIDIEPDRILLDAPCSGEGLIPIDPTRKTSKSMADVRYCATREGDMLEAAVEKLRIGGVLVYATCSIAPEENEFVVDNVLRNHPEMEIGPITQDFGSPGYPQPYGVQLDESLKMAKRFLPQKDGTEGFFICRMRKVGAL